MQHGRECGIGCRRRTADGALTVSTTRKVNNLLLQASKYNFALQARGDAVEAPLGTDAA
jgi:hypothetical protein